MYLRFRKIGASVCNHTKTSALSISPHIQSLDFAANYSTEEDAYVYSTVDWNIEPHIGPHLAGRGNYEIMIETVWVNPLREEIIAGEEIVIAFIEALECSEPLPFDISVRSNDAIDHTVEDLYIKCEGRTIGFQFKLVSIQYENLLGKEFQVEIFKMGEESVSNFFYANGNSMSFSIVFSRSFAEIDLSASSTPFRLFLENFSGGTGHISDEISNQIRKKIRAVAGMNYDTRIPVALQNDSYHHDLQTARATAHIAPGLGEEKGLRRLRANSIDEVHAVSLF